MDSGLVSELLTLEKEKRFSAALDLRIKQGE
jgi:hypothetical protein